MIETLSIKLTKTEWLVHIAFNVLLVVVAVVLAHFGHVIGAWALGIWGAWGVISALLMPLNPFLMRKLAEPKNEPNKEFVLPSDLSNKLLEMKNKQNKD